MSVYTSTYNGYLFFITKWAFYYKMGLFLLHNGYLFLLQNGHLALLQNGLFVITKWVFITKWAFFYYKMGTYYKMGSYYKMGLNKRCKDIII